MFATTAILTASPNIWRAALGSPLSVKLIALAAALVLLAAVLLRAMIRLGMSHSRGARPAPGCRAESGVATIEFALLLPILLFVGLALTQTTLLMGGNLFVHYAAFAAARSAIVQVPADYDAQPPNIYTADADSPKHRAIHRAAALALVPVAGRSGDDTNGLLTERIVRGFARFYEGYGQTPPPWIEGQLAQRLNYAAAHTRIQLLRSSDDDPGRIEPIGEGETAVFGTRDTIGVRVVHQLNLPVPYVDRLFADGSSGGRRRYITLTARAFLQNAGLRDDMPPEPSLRRMPQ